MTRRRAAGFTLLEVIAAIVILALSAAVLMHVLGASMTLTRKAAARTQVAAWAQSLLDSAFVLQRPKPGVTQGQFNPRYRWKLTVTAWQPPRTQARPSARRTNQQAQDNVHLYKLDLAVAWGPRQRQHVAHFDTLRAVRTGAGGMVP